MGAISVPDQVELLISRKGDLDHLYLHAHNRCLVKDAVNLGRIGNISDHRLIRNHEASHPLGFIIGSLLHGGLLGSIYDFRAELVLGGLQNLSHISSQAGGSLRYAVRNDSRVNLMARGLQMLIGDYLHTAGVIDLIQSDVDKAEETLNRYL